MTDAPSNAHITELMDREAIRDVLFRYAHGIDRCDAELLRTVYWPEGTDDHGDFSGKRDDFIEWVIPTLKSQMSTSQHLMTNILIRVAGTKAQVETYFHAYHRWGQFDAKAAEDFWISGRYLDEMEKRGSEWRIARRVVVFDHFREYDDTGNWAAAKYVNTNRKLGLRVPQDPSHELFESSLTQPPFRS